MHVDGRFALHPGLRRLAVCALLLCALAGVALAFEDTAASEVATTAAIDHARGSPARPAPAFRKLDARLAALVDPGLAYGVPVWSRRQAASLLAVRAGRVPVEIEASRPAAARAAVIRLGGVVTASFRSLIEARLPTRSLAALAHEGSVELVRPPIRGRADAVPGEEVQASLASALHAKGITGKGTKVAIIDGGFAGLAERQASGDLPTNVVTKDLCDGQFATGEDHGTAVAEIVHEMAPAAQLYLICFAGDVASLAAAEAYAKSQGVQIVNFSVEYFNIGRGTDDATDPIDAIVADARANGILWVNSAGNDALTHWSGTFVDSNGNGYLDYSSSPLDEGNTFTWPAGLEVCGFLKWDEWPVAKSDFDLVLFQSSNGQIIASSTGVQDGSQPPTEQICVTNLSGATMEAAWGIVGSHVTTSPRLDFFSTPIPPPYLQFQTPPGSVGDPASSPSAFAVGAVCWQNNVLEPYSSQGPTVDGRLKPDISGHDSVSSATFGPFVSACPSGFAGTSASTPEVAGAAALVKQAEPGFTAAQIESFLEKSATDLGASGPDDQTGAGALRLPTDIVTRDTTRPKATALLSKGKRGHVVKLLSRVSDDSGSVKIRDQVKQNGRVIKTLTTSGFVSAAAPRVGYFGWKAGPRLTGTITHCVRAQDRSRNVSAVSCARVALS
jgi:subtilisin family serine protease